MIVDLSMPVNEETVVFPGDELPKFEQAGTMKTEGFVDHVIHINNHLGTHVDLPAHMVAGGKTLLDYPVTRFIQEAVCVNAANQSTMSSSLLDGIDIKPGNAILFYTGTSEHFKDQTYAEGYPEFTQELADALVKQRISMVGVDMISYDHDAPFPIHKTLLGADILLIENLVNLKELVGKRCKLYAMPINFDLEAAPARVVAEVEV